MDPLTDAKMCPMACQDPTCHVEDRIQTKHNHGTKLWDLQGVCIPPSWWPWWLCCPWFLVAGDAWCLAPAAGGNALLCFVLSQQRHRGSGSFHRSRDCPPPRRRVALLQPATIHTLRSDESISINKSADRSVASGNVWSGSRESSESWGHQQGTRSGKKQRESKW